VISSTRLQCKAYYAAYVNRIMPLKCILGIDICLMGRIMGSAIQTPTFANLGWMMEAAMQEATQSDPKCNSLREHGSLNPYPERVHDALFQTHPFFDPRDLVQVKYEMVRRVICDGQPVGVTAAAFGFSRVRLYQLRKRFEAEGLAGLLPQTKGPQRAHKLSDDVLIFILQTLQAEPELRTAELPQRVAQRFGFSVHIRSIERALARHRKKDRPPQYQRMCLILLLFGVCRSV
jgi:transposase